MKLEDVKLGKIRRALTLVELMVLLALAAIFGAMLFPALNRPGRIPRLQCVRNLRQIGLAARIFATDHMDLFPSAVSTNEGGCAEFSGNRQAPSHYLRCLSKQFTNTSVLVCPQDTRKAAADFLSLQNSNISYFIGWSASELLPQGLLSGDRNLGRSSGWLDLYPTSRVEWSTSQHNSMGSIGLADGSVQQMTIPRLQQQLRESGLTNRLVIP